MVIIKLIYLIGGICLILGGLIYLFFRHQRRLKARAFLMREAVRNGDYAFRLPTSGLLPGERALQQALNDMQGDIARLVARHEVESWQKLTRVLTHEIMNATAPISSICQAYLSNPQIKGSEYEEGIQAIHDTSKSLTNFVDSYRKLPSSRLPSQNPSRSSLSWRASRRSIPTSAGTFPSLRMPRWRPTATCCDRYSSTSPRTPSKPMLPTSTSA